jgi:hypothetical protein
MMMKPSVAIMTMMIISSTFYRQCSSEVMLLHESRFKTYNHLVGPVILHQSPINDSFSGFLSRHLSYNEDAWD